MKKWGVGIVVAVVVVASGAFAFWYTQIRVESKPEAELRETEVRDTGAAVDGSYTIPPGSQSFVGYRAQEVVFGRAQTPTGRTGDVTGSLTVSRSTINDVKVTAALTGLSTGNERRDGRAQSALATDRFPDTTFELTEPIELSAAPTAGKKVTATAVGDLTIKGTTKRVAIPLEGRWDGTQIEIVTAEPFPITFSDFGVSVGDFRPIAEVQDRGQLELDLFFTKA